MPPVLDPENSKVDGLAFLGLSLARNHYHDDGDDSGNGGEAQKLGHPDSYTHQTAFDLNEVIDRDYEFIQSTDDNGWLVGGGEAGPPTSYKLPALDSAHVEIMRIGTYRKDWGGLDLQELLGVMQSGAIRIPQIVVLPTDVVANPDTPPELEIRFDMECMTALAKSLESGDFEAFCREPLPVNWQLRFLHNQFFRTFVFPSRFCPGAFHSTILRKADFRSDAHRTLYFCKCADAIRKWREMGPQPLNTVPRHRDGTPLTEEEDCHSGIWLFTDRETITHFFPPNFFPPYDTPEKRRIIFEVLREEWDEGTLSWKPCGHGSMTRKDPAVTNTNVLHKAETMVSGVLKTVIDSVCSPQTSPRRQSSAKHF
eukprot:jgi/Psemu1/207713/e_gw1.445.41.1